MPHKRLDRPDIATVLQQMRGETVPLGMDAGVLADAGKHHRPRNSI